jgi:hypothetical protein
VEVLEAQIPKLLQVAEPAEAAVKSDTSKDFSASLAPAPPARVQAALSAILARNAEVKAA